MNALTPSDRVQLRSQGELQLPGSCALCGSGNCQDGYLDFNLWIEFLGTFYLCVTCFDQAAKVANYLSPDEAEHIKALNESLGPELTSTKLQLKEANELLANWNAVIGDIANRTITNPDDSPAVSVGDPEVNEPAAEVDEGPASGAAAGESEPAESTTVKRRTKPNGNAAGNGSSPEFSL